MNFTWVKTHRLIKTIFSNYVWDIPNSENRVYLTFDDGPTPEITEWTLSQLKNHNAKATFFCIGDNVRKYPEIVQKVIDEGHSIGNHTFNHLNGWKTATDDYVKNVELCYNQKAEGRRQKAEGNLHSEEENLHSKICVLPTEFFRPPYGKIKPSQSKVLRKLGYRIIMWDIISYDFDANVSEIKCLENVLNNVQSGSIIVFHDSKKAYKNLEYALPQTLEFLKERGFICEKL
jgi:peptidoglycan/xylan/chitin deacetylase (PgdA/CDA1 family)